MKIMKFLDSFISNLKSILLAVFVAILIRSFIFEPFNIPSGSMKPNLLVGDFIFVSKWSYGFSKHSLPFSIPLIPNKIFTKFPNRGEVIVFKAPYDNRTDYIKRVIGLPGDKIIIENGNVIINHNMVLRKKIDDFVDINKNGKKTRIRQYEELFYDLEIKVLDLTDKGPVDNTIQYDVPDNHVFVMGDNRDNSQDSRFLNRIGYIPIENIIGKAQYIFFSLENSRFFQIWKWPKAIRVDRIMKIIK
mgnify:CR=1 FL=1